MYTSTDMFVMGVIFLIFGLFLGWSFHELFIKENE